MNAAATIWYFAYGSNMETATFRGRRGIAFTRALPARVADWRVVLDKPPLIPIGGAVANIVPEPGAHVLGVLYELTPGELTHVELTEGVILGNYRRVEVQVETLTPPTIVTPAVSLASDRRDPTLLPTDRYMGCVIAGAVEHDLPADYVAFLRAVPVCPEVPGLRAMIDGVFRGLRPAPDAAPDDASARRTPRQRNRP